MDRKWDAISNSYHTWDRSSRVPGKILANGIQSSGWSPKDPMRPHKPQAKFNLPLFPKTFGFSSPVFGANGAVKISSGIHYTSLGPITRIFGHNGEKELGQGLELDWLATHGTQSAPSTSHHHPVPMLYRLMIMTITHSSREIECNFRADRQRFELTS